MRLVPPPEVAHVLAAAQPVARTLLRLPAYQVLVFATLLVASLAAYLVVSSALPHYPWSVAAVGFLLVVGESFLPFLPLGPLVAVNVLLLGPLDGFFLSWMGAVIGSSGAYALARSLGHAGLMSRLPASYRSKLAEAAARTGFASLLFAWLVPGLNCVVAYGAGAANVPFARFLATAALGLAPWVALYALATYDASAAGSGGILLACAAVLVAGVYLVQWQWRQLRRL